VADLVDRCCDHAAHMAALLAEGDGVEVLNDVVLNQVLVRFGDSDELTNAVIERVQQGGVCWLSGSSFRGRAVMRVSVVGWQTTEEDVQRSARAILDAVPERMEQRR
jgi:threonine aldolase